MGATLYQEALKLEYPERKAVSYRKGLRTKPQGTPRVSEVDLSEMALVSDDRTPASEMPLVQRAHPDLGRLGVFWKTQGSGKSYSMRDDIIVISDEAHRSQAGKFARTMRLALPNASFLGFTGTPPFKHDHLTKRIIGSYISRYDFKRSVEDGSTVRLVYASRQENTEFGLDESRSNKKSGPIDNPREKPKTLRETQSGRLYCVATPENKQ